MKTKPKEFKNFATLKDYFNTEDKCRKYLESARWGNSGIACPHCGSTGYYVLSDGKNYKCKDCIKRFNVLTKTVMENTKVSLILWMQAMWLMTSHKKGISSVQLGKDMGVTQKTGWYLAHRIRLMVNNNNNPELSGIVEADETYVGGSIENMPIKKRQQLRDAKIDNKIQVMGLIQRGGNVVTYVSKPDDTQKTFKKMILDNIDEKNTKFYTDGARMYKNIKLQVQKFDSVNHSLDEYVRGEVHTNSIEGFWSILKRGIYGIYHHVSPKHLQRYCNEFSFRHNTRELTETERFRIAFTQINNTKLGYVVLINSKGSAYRTITANSNKKYRNKAEEAAHRERFLKALKKGKPGELF